ncbi:uncharacterized protein BX663DRAFT_525378, partial [Cokeromyces recurvatus]|uniref:uncharacterized protein n=1 Tax=Cokeromyces recurvatus TaxID=90255 RepID=UPI0022209F74
MTNFSVSNTNSLGRILNRLRKYDSVDYSNKDFWIPDEQCKECNSCKAPFNLFRRRHHCRTCGQIFCSKCLSNNIHTSQSLRVCNNCYNKYHADDINLLNDAVIDNVQPSQQSQKTFLIPTSA